MKKCSMQKKMESLHANETKMENFTKAEVLKALDDMKNAYRTLFFATSDTTSPCYNMINDAIETGAVDTEYEDTFSRSFDELFLEEWVDKMTDYVDGITQF